MALYMSHVASQSVTSTIQLNTLNSAWFYDTVFWF